VVRGIQACPWAMHLPVHRILLPAGFLIDMPEPPALLVRCIGSGMGQCGLVVLLDGAQLCMIGVLTDEKVLLECLELFRETGCSGCWRLRCPGRSVLGGVDRWDDQGALRCSRGWPPR
jgi:hypothetical protein